MSEDKELPPGYGLNSSEQKEALRAALMSAAVHFNGLAPAVAVVFTMPDGTVTAGLIGDLKDLSAFAKLLTSGPEILRLTVKRFIAGKGETSVVKLP